MKLLSIFALTVAAASPVVAQQTRQQDTHEHGVGQLNIAFDGNTVAIELHAPGADIVGFEYEAESADDHAAIDAAIATLSMPLALFAFPAAAGCSTIEAKAGLEGEAVHDEDHDNNNNDHADDENHGDHAEHEDQDDHADKESGHTEFHAEYLVECTDPSAVDVISFAYFDAFPNALEVEVQLISNAGASAYEVERGAPMLEFSDQL